MISDNNPIGPNKMAAQGTDVQSGFLCNLCMTQGHELVAVTKLHVVESKLRWPLNQYNQIPVVTAH